MPVSSVRLAPLEARPQPLLESGRDLTPVGMPVQRRLAEDQLSVKRHLEVALAPGSQLHAAHDRRPTGEQLIGQAHGPVEVVSRDAVFDDCVVLGVDH